MVFFKGWEPPAGVEAPCAFCRGPVPVPGEVRCKRCQVVYHPECWAANSSRCAVYGCEPGKPARAPVRAATATPARPGGGAHWGWIVVVVISALTRALPSHHSPQSFPPAPIDTHLNRDWTMHSETYRPPDFKTLGFGDVDGELEGTEGSYSRAIGRDPGSLRAREGRAYLRYDQGRWAGALDDFHEALKLGSTNEGYLRLRIWLLQVRMGLRQEADRELSAALEARQDRYEGLWEAQIAEYFLGRRTESDLLLLAQDRPRTCQALYYVGSRRLACGDPDGARSFLLRCVGTAQTNYREFRTAVVELRAFR